MTPLTAGHRRIVEALVAGGRLRRDEAGWRIGVQAVAAGDVEVLARHDLVAVEGAEALLTPAGRGWAARRARPDDPPNRLLAERVLPDDAAKPEGRRRRVTANLAESPLGWLKARGLVSPRQFEAGERLRADWTVAGLGARVTMRWESGAASTAPGRLDPTLTQIAAKRRVEAAMAAAGPGLSDVLWRAVCAGEGLETAEKALGWPARAGRVVLTLALDRVADHYGLG